MYRTWVKVTEWAIVIHAPPPAQLMDICEDFEETVIAWGLKGWINIKRQK